MQDKANLRWADMPTPDQLDKETQIVWLSDQSESYSNTDDLPALRWGDLPSRDQSARQEQSEELNDLSESFDSTNKHQELREGNLPTYADDGQGSGHDDANCKEGDPLECVHSEYLDKGGMGELYLQHHRNGSRSVVKSALRIDQEYAITNEVNALRRLPNHPNLVTLLSASGDDLSLSLEYIEGENLRQRAYAAVRGKPFSPVEMKNIIVGVATGLEIIHSKWIVHFDIKPSNIMLKTNGTPVICDFGLAHSADYNGAVQKTCPVGTLDYIAPEVLDEPYQGTFKSDIYSFGVTLVSCVTGNDPYQLTHSNAVIFLQERIDGARDIVIPENLDKSLTALATSCLGFFAKERPTATALKLRAQKLDFPAVFVQEPEENAAVFEPK